MKSTEEQQNKHNTNLSDQENLKNLNSNQNKNKISHQSISESNENYTNKVKPQGIKTQSHTNFLPEANINFKKTYDSSSTINHVYEEEDESMTLATFEEGRLQNGNQNLAKNISNSFIFPLLGITCFISMNAFIALQDCFVHFQKDFHPESFFNNIFFFANTAAQIILSCVNINLKTWSLLKLSLIVPCFTLILFTFLICFFTNLLNYIVCCLLVFVIGVFSGVFLYVINGILPFIELKNLVLVITGQALSSVFISIIRIFTFFIFEKNFNDKQTTCLYNLIVTFSSALLVLFVSFILLYFLKNRVDFYTCFYKLDRKHRTGIFDSAVLMNNNNDKDITGDCLENSHTKKSQFELIKFTISKNKLFFANVTLFAFITYLFHPVVFVNLKLFTAEAQLSIILTIIYFNLFDSIGRLTTNLFYVRTKKRLYLLNLLRFYFFLVFILINIWITNNSNNNNNIKNEDNNNNNSNNHYFLYYVQNFLTNEIFILINIALFGFSYGFINCNSFILLGGIKDPIIQFKSNMITSICIGGGIFIGSSLSNIICYLA